MFCPNCRVEYRDGFTQCADCGEQLVENLIEKCIVCGNELPYNINKICIVCKINQKLNNKSHRWIRIMKFFAWISSFLIFLIGIILGIRNSSIYGCLFISYNLTLFFIYIIISFIIAFLLLVGTMIFLDMAEDIKAIRNNTQNKEK